MYEDVFLETGLLWIPCNLVEYNKDPWPSIYSGRNIHANFRLVFVQISIQSSVWVYARFWLQGLATLTVAVAIPHSQIKAPLFFASLYLVAIGQGGHKPCVQAFGADQFKEETKEERRTKNSFFNWWYHGLCGGGTSAMLMVFYVQDNVGWTTGYCILAIAMTFALVLFLLGRRLYRRQVPSGSSLTRVAQVLVAAAR